MPTPQESTSGRPIVRGLFVSLDGPDGGGKTMQAARLVDWLRGLGREVVACRDPGGTVLGERVRGLLLERSRLAIGVRTEMLLFMAARAQLVEEIIRPALASGKVVVSDRFLLANVVYQGTAGGLAIDDLWRVGAAATGGLLPDLTVVLDVPVDVAAARVGAPRDRMEDRTDASRSRVRDGFLELARTYPAPIVVIDGSAEPDAVAARLQGEVAHALGIGPRP